MYTVFMKGGKEKEGEKKRKEGEGKKRKGREGKEKGDII